MTASCGVAFALALTDVLVGRFGPGAPDASGWITSIAFLHVLALVGAPAVPIGCVLGLTRHAALQSAWLGGAARWLESPRRWLVPDPRVTSELLGGACALASASLSLLRGYVYFSTQLHRQELAAVANMLFTLFVVVVASVIWTTTAWVARRLLERVPTLARPVLLLAPALSGGVLAVARYVTEDHGLRAAFTGLEVAVLPCAALGMYVGTLIATRATRSMRHPARLVLGFLVLTITALVVSALRYGVAGNGTRTLVEQRSVITRRLMRVYIRSTDRDGDRYSFAFGARDCDDTRVDVHPGAPDVRGDGVDADCFAGDGSPIVIERGDGDYAPVPAAATRPNILLFTIDALRPDHLGAHGYDKPTSPAIDRFARQSVVFEQAISQSSRSLRSLPSMFLGKYPAQVAFGPEYLWPSITQDERLLAEVLTREGYATAAVIGTDYFGQVPSYFRGFASVDQSPQSQPSPDTTTELTLRKLRDLAAGSRPFFLWTHLFNVHEPRATIDSAFGSGLVGNYDFEVNRADSMFARVIEVLETLPSASRTVVILASDHGESLGEHGVRGHCTTVYETEIRSVLMIRAPGIEHRVVRTPVGLLDLAPTVMNFAGIPQASPISGRSLLGLMQGGQGDPRRPIVSEIVPDGLWPWDSKSLRVGSQKLIWWPQTGLYQLFDLARDPNELRDLSDARPEASRRLLGELRAWVAETADAQNSTERLLATHRATRPFPMQHTLGATLPGVFTVLGFDLPPRARRGEAIPVTLYFRADDETDRDFFFEVDFIGPPGYPMPRYFNGNHYPLYARYHTPAWRAGDHIRDPSPVVPPPSTRYPVTLNVVLRVLDASGPRRTPVALVHRGEARTEIPLGHIRLE